MKVYFKSEGHFEGMVAILKKMGIENYKYQEYLSFAYLIASSSKVSDVKKYIDEEGIEVEELQKAIAVYSSSEKAMIRFAMQLFNQNMDDIKLNDVFWSLDAYNTKAVIEAIKIRFDYPVTKTYVQYTQENM